MTVPVLARRDRGVIAEYDAVVAVADEPPIPLTVVRRVALFVEMIDPLSRKTPISPEPPRRRIPSASPGLRGRSTVRDNHAGSRRCLLNARGDRRAGLDVDGEIIALAAEPPPRSRSPWPGPSAEVIVGLRSEVDAVAVAAAGAAGAGHRHGRTGIAVIVPPNMQMPKLRRRQAQMCRRYRSPPRPALPPEVIIAFSEV